MRGHLQISNLTKSFGGLNAIRDVTMALEPGVRAAVIGPNGAGKTTLFNMITGHLSPTAGSIRLDEGELIGLRPGAIVRRGISRAFQVASLFGTFTVREAMAAAVLSHRQRLFDLIGAFPAPAAFEHARHILSLIGLSDVEKSRCDTLSHGDRKLLDIALALALEPRILLLDEPTAGMGRDESRLMIDRIYRLWEAEGMSLVFIEHDMDIVFGIAEQVFVLRNGALLASGEPAEVRRHPQVIEAYLGSAT
ncbi:ABC transporter ATP-binding protein [Bradyrhizobium tropiciagri]|uniref:ABC transporter ATP-binding protein n=1 Tax=Bradyrhizobium tropiciagri TaxID=312253 RepID=UPI00067B956B|nr:ATP-binding cassette domain-containing protein [Bradyrhizobium tropiciagri]